MHYLKDSVEIQNTLLYDKRNIFFGGIHDGKNRNNKESFGNK